MSSFAVSSSPRRGVCVAGLRQASAVMLQRSVRVNNLSFLPPGRAWLSLALRCGCVDTEGWRAAPTLAPLRAQCHEAGVGGVENE